MSDFAVANALSDATDAVSDADVITDACTDADSTAYANADTDATCSDATPRIAVADAYIAPTVDADGRRASSSYLINHYCCNVFFLLRIDR